MYAIQIYTKLKENDKKKKLGEFVCLGHVNIISFLT